MSALLIIEKEKLKLTHIAERLNLSIQETSRHLLRLRDAKLIGKDSDGLYYLTPFGLTVARLLPSYRFILRNRDYFQDHDLSRLPPEFIERIGELEENELGQGPWRSWIFLQSQYGKPKSTSGNTGTKTQICSGNNPNVKSAHSEPATENK